MGKRGYAVVAVFVVLVLVVGLVVALPRLRKGGDTGPEEAQTFPTIPTPPAGATAQAAVDGVPTGPKATPQEESFKGCPAGGDGTDPPLNTLKNRVDPVAAPVAVPFDHLLNLPWPQGVAKKHMDQWSAADRAVVDRHNGVGVTVEAYFIRVQSEGPESPNCHSTTDVDFHEWITGNANDDRTKAIVIEMGPRLRAKHAGWTLQAFQKLATQKAKVRVTGWVMLDPEHPDQIGKTRGNIWEIHPVTKMEVNQNGQWVDLDTLK